MKIVRETVCRLIYAEDEDGNVIVHSNWRSAASPTSSSVSRTVPAACRMSQRLASPKDGFTLTGKWIYDPVDPYAVTLILEKGTVRWTFSRDLLIHGKNAHSVYGDMDVKIHSETHIVCVHLSSGDGVWHLAFFQDSVDEFCRAMLACVPEGREEEHFNLDKEIDSLLH